MSTTTEKPESKAAAKRREQQEAVAWLRKECPPGTTICTTLAHVSRSGMYRHVKVVIPGGPDGVRNISGEVAAALGWTWHDDGSVGVSGCGMDAGFHMVHQLSYALHPDGFACLGKGCPSNTHFNREPHRKDGGKGYSLRHRWL